MAIILKQLGQARPADTNTATLYNPGASIDAVAHRVVICNTGTTAASARVFHDDNGSTFDETTALAWDILVGTASVATLDLSVALSDDTGKLGIRSSVASALTFTAYGSEET